MKFKVFLINMKKDDDRLSFMSSQLRRENIDFFIQEGINGKEYNFGSIYDNDLCVKFNNKPLTDSEKGCALSHRLILEQILKENLDYALVLEDDIELPFNFKKIINIELKKREEEKTHWEYLSFNYPSVGFRFIHLWLFLLFRMFEDGKGVKNYFKIPIFLIKFIFILIFSVFEGVRDFLYKKIYKRGKVSRFFRPLYLAGCYLITREGAKKLLIIQNKLIYTADRLPNVARIKKKLKFYAFVPLIVKQRRDKFKSNLLIDHKHFFNN